MKEGEKDTYEYDRISLCKRSHVQDRLQKAPPSLVPLSKPIVMSRGKW